MLFGGKNMQLMVPHHSCLSDFARPLFVIVCCPKKWQATNSQLCFPGEHAPSRGPSTFGPCMINLQGLKIKGQLFPSSRRSLVALIQKAGYRPESGLSDVNSAKKKTSFASPIQWSKGAEQPQQDDTTAIELYKTLQNSITVVTD